MEKSFEEINGYKLPDYTIGGIVKKGKSKEVIEFEDGEIIIKPNNRKAKYGKLLEENLDLSDIENTFKKRFGNK